jgi:molybdopterin-binding protein
MNPQESKMLLAARWLTFGSAASILFSIAISQSLMGIAFVALLASGEKLRLPRIKWPLGFFMLGTAISLAFSAQPSAGWPQIRKFYVFLIVLLVYSTLRNLKYVRRLFLAWCGIAGLTALYGFGQFAMKAREAAVAGQGFYDYYIADRIKGFTSNWNTYSGEEMLALIMLVALLLFAPRARWAWLWALCGLLIAIAVLLADTRGVWFATAAAFIYLAWSWKRWAVALVPAAILIVFVLAPAPLRERFTSIVQPRKIDSNAFRKVVWRTGLAMIRRHPLLGLGPQQVGKHFDEYVPADIERPLPDGYYGHLHSIYIHYAAERGIPTMLMLVWMLIQMLVDFGRGLGALPPGRSVRRFLLAGAIAAVLAVAVEGVVELNLGDSEVLTMFLTIAACGYLALDAGREAEPALSVSGAS